jgi:agmatine deiminase
LVAVGPEEAGGSRMRVGGRETRARVVVLTAGIILLTGAEAGLAAPVQPVRMCAEWEPAVGTLIRWPLGIPSTLVVELAEDDSLYVLVETPGQESQARAAFASWGVNLGHCRFIYAQTYSHWTRDWGPHSVFDGDGVWGIVDPVFDGYPWVSGCDLKGAAGAEPGASLAVPEDRRGGRGWEEDDAVNAVLAQEFDCPLHELPAYLTGGNLMADGHGTAFSTEQMVDENAPLWSQMEFLGLALQYIGATAYRIVTNPDLYGLQHIDCWAKLLDEETILVKSLPLWHPELPCIEAVVEEVEQLTTCYGRPYKIVRVFCGAYSGNNTAAYTNSLILNRKVLVPLFGIPSDQAALDAYEAAMPGYEVLGFSYGSWYYYDALHCRVMGIYDRHMLRIWHRPLDQQVLTSPEFPIDVMIDDRSEAGLMEDSLCVYWRSSGGPTWNPVALTGTAGTDSFTAGIPWQPPGTIVEYYIAAADSSGRRETLPRTAPGGWYTFTVTDAMSLVTIAFEADSVRLRWEAVPGAMLYRVYSSDLPYSGFSEDTSGTLSGTEWVAPVSGTERYYHVTAVSAPSLVAPSSE